MIHGGDVAIQGKLAGAETNGRFGRGKQEAGEAADRFLLRIRHAVAVVERKVVARRLGIGMYVFEQARADIEFLRGPGRFGGFLVQTEIGNGLLRDVGLALLLVVIKSDRGGVQILGVGEERGVGIVAKLAQILRVAQKIEVTLDELRIPQRLEALLVNREAVAH